MRHGSLRLEGRITDPSAWVDAPKNFTILSTNTVMSLVFRKVGRQEIGFFCKLNIIIEDMMTLLNSHNPTFVNLLMLYLKTFQSFRLCSVEWIIHLKERGRKRLGLFQLGVLSRHTTWGTEGKQEIVRLTHFLAEIWTRDLSNTKQELYTHDW
jgi:hypothetical protein